MNAFNCTNFTRLFHLSFIMMNSLVFSVAAQSETKENKVNEVVAEKIAQNKADYAAKNKYQVQIKAREDHEFLLSADYRFFPEKATARNMSGVIVLHDCKSNRSKYNSLSASIAEQGLHTLSLDLRGYGKSIDEGYSEREVKKIAKNIVSYDSEIAVLMSYWSEDLLAAYNFLRTKVNKNEGISVVASGCSGTYAVLLADVLKVKSLVLLTPKMSYADKERYKNLIDTPSYFISSAQHAMSYTTAQELFTWSGDKHSKHQIYKGDKLNYKIIEANQYLVNDIALWLKFTLR